MRQIRREIIWDEISSGQWMKLYMDRRIMTDIMMHIFSILYRAVGMLTMLKT